jgi:hypothetical protein
VKRALALVGLLLSGCGGAALTPRPVELIPANSERAFMRWNNGWRLSLAPPRFPYNTETVVFAGMSGAGTGAPFGCGVEYAPAGYFSMARGPLVCAIGQPGGAVRLAPVGRTLHYRVFDAAPTPDGLTVVTAPHGGGLSVTTLSPRGDIMRDRLLPVRNPDQVVVLPSGRLVVLNREDGGCFWTVLDLEGEAPRQISRTPADHAYQCHSSSFARTVLHDQTTGEAYLYFDHPTEHGLYRIGEPGPAGPAALVADMADGVPLNESSEPRALMVNDGIVLFSGGRTAAFGPRIGVRDLAAGQSVYVDLPGSGSPQPSSNVSVIAFLPPVAAGGAPRVVLQHPRTGHSTIETIEVSAAVGD